MERLKSPAHLLAVLGAYTLLFWPVLSDPLSAPDFDGIRYHLPYFIYFADSLGFGFGLPYWFPTSGGLPVSTLSISLFPLLPHRLLGYGLLAGLKGLDYISAYKLSVFSGMLPVLLGWWLFLRKWTGYRSAATIGTLAVFMGGAGFTVLHQEQLMVTFMLWPWLLLALLKSGEDMRYFPAVGALLGISMTIHYPQIQLLAFLFLIISLTLTGRLTTGSLKLAKEHKWYLLAALMLFIACASPSIQILSGMSEFSSPVRSSSNLDISSYRDYIRINTMQKSSASLEYFENYVNPFSSWLKSGTHSDRAAFFVTHPALLLAMFGLALNFRKAMPVLLVTLLGAWATLGINGFFPQLLFKLQFPFIKYFRQWIHFMPVINLGLGALCALGMATLFGDRGRVFFASRRQFQLATAAVFALVSLTMFFEGYLCIRDYKQTKLASSKNVTKRLNKSDYLLLVSSMDFRKSYINKVLLGPDFNVPPILLSYKDRFNFDEVCQRTEVDKLFSTVNIYSSSGTDYHRLLEVLERACKTGLAGYSAAVGTPPSGMGALAPRTILLDRYLFSDLEMDRLRANTTLSNNYVITPRGISATLDFKVPELLVVPFAYPLGLEASLNGKPVPTHEVNGGAMTGVTIPPGTHVLDLRMPPSPFYWLMLLQGGVLLGIIVYSLGLKMKKGSSLVE